MCEEGIAFRVAAKKGKKRDKSPLAAGRTIFFLRTTVKKNIALELTEQVKKRRPKIATLDEISF